MFFIKFIIIISFGGLLVIGIIFICLILEKGVELSSIGYEFSVLVGVEFIYVTRFRLLVYLLLMYSLITIILMDFRDFPHLTLMFYPLNIF